MNSYRPIKVAHVLKDLVVGGIQSLLLDTLRYYEEIGQECLFIGIGSGELQTEFEKHPNSYFIRKKLPFLDPIVILKIRNILQKEDIDVVHAHHSSEGVASYFATRGLAVKCVQSFHVAPQINNRQDQWAFKKLARLIDGNIVPSQSQLDALQKAGYPSRNMQVIPNGISQKRLRTKSDKKLHNELGLGDNAVLLGMVGNFYNDTRDQLTVCRALTITMQQFPQVFFVFYGGHENPYSPEAKSYRACVDICRKAGLQDRVFFPGIETDTAAVYQALDVFVYSSLHDTFGIAVAEAMLSGIPVVVNDLPVLMEITDHGKHAQVFETHNAESLSRVLNTVLNNPSQANARAVRAQTFAEERYPISNHVNSLKRYYAQILSTK